AQDKKEEALAYAERAKARALLDVLQSGKVNVTKAMTAEEQEREQKLRSDMNSLNAQYARASQDGKKKIAGLLDRAKLGYEDYMVELYAAHPELKAQRGEAPPLTLAQAGELLPDDRTALLNFIVAKHKTLLFAITKPKQSGEPQLNVYSLPIKLEELAQSVSRFRDKLSARSLDFKAESRKLYHQLLQSAQPQLRGVTRVVIVPDGALWELPFQ